MSAFLRDFLARRRGPLQCRVTRVTLRLLGCVIAVSLRFSARCDDAAFTSHMGHTADHGTVPRSGVAADNWCRGALAEIASGTGDPLNGKQRV
eukprot:548863-Prorocentrum_minimum.AAC.2